MELSVIPSHHAFFALVALFFIQTLFPISEAPGDHWHLIHRGTSLGKIGLFQEPQSICHSWREECDEEISCLVWVRWGMDWAWMIKMIPMTLMSLMLLTLSDCVRMCTHVYTHHAHLCSQGCLGPFERRCLRCKGQEFDKKCPKPTKSYDLRVQAWNRRSLAFRNPRAPQSHGALGRSWLREEVIAREHPADVIRSNPASAHITLPARTATNEVQILCTK